MARKISTYLTFMACMLGLSSQSAEAQFYTGNELHDKCGTSRAIALGYTVGFIDSQIMSNWADSSQLFNMCLPKAITSGQVTDITCQFLASNPAKRHHPANGLVLEALQRAFPCAEQKRTR